MYIFFKRGVPKSLEKLRELCTNTSISSLLILLVFYFLFGKSQVVGVRYLSDLLTGKIYDILIALSYMVWFHVCGSNNMILES